MVVRGRRLVARVSAERRENLLALQVFELRRRASLPLATVDPTSGSRTMAVTRHSLYVSLGRESSRTRRSWKGKL